MNYLTFLMASFVLFSVFSVGWFIPRANKLSGILRICVLLTIFLILVFLHQLLGIVSGTARFQPSEISGWMASLVVSAAIFCGGLYVEHCQTRERKNDK